jgi:hypothetical protein
VMLPFYEHNRAVRIRGLKRSDESSTPYTPNRSIFSF